MKQASKKPIRPFQTIESLKSFRYFFKIILDFLVKHRVSEVTNVMINPE